jgi:hypothetical protein
MTWISRTMAFVGILLLVIGAFGAWQQVALGGAALLVGAIVLRLFWEDGSSGDSRKERMSQLRDWLADTKRISKIMALGGTAFLIAAAYMKYDGMTVSAAALIGTALLGGAIILRWLWSS